MQESEDGVHETQRNCLLLRALAQRATRKGRHVSQLHLLAQVDGEPREDAHEAVVSLPGSSDDGSEGGSNESFTLRNIDFSVKAGELLCVTGRVGSGKSSLVSTFVCHMCLSSQLLRLCTRPRGNSWQIWNAGAPGAQMLLFQVHRGGLACA